MTRSGWFNRLLLPGFVFQSVVIAGGYGTGRELVEFFLTLGPRGGLLAMLVATLTWSAVCAVSFEFARAVRGYDYRRFFRELLGPGWVLFEICYVALLAVVLAVIAAAAGSMLRETFGLPYGVGVAGITAAVGWLVFAGSRAIERALAFWSFVLYAVYVVFFVWSLRQSGGTGSALAGDAAGGWLVGGLKYAAYNVAVIPAVLFTIRHAAGRRDAVVAGVLAGPIAMIPGLLFYLAMVPHYPGIVDLAVPATYLLGLLDARWFLIAYQVMLFGTLIETGTGMIHAVNQRVAHAFAERSRTLPRWVRPVLAVVLLLAATALAQLGLVALIARGYGTLTWAFLAVFVLPVLTWGVWRLWRLPKPVERLSG
ncbi:MAG TPA: hypothetical protein VFH97_03390 [Gemmatimonadales bacterium]|nr:hypothetical protein [Gemmatimonadales bacterium]